MSTKGVLLTLAAILATAFYCVLGPLPLGLLPLLEAPYLVVLGWIHFLQRTLSQITVDWSGVMTGLILVVVLGYGFHRLGRWLQTWPRETKIAWRWTNAPMLVLGVTTLFAAGLAGVGLVRSLQWFLRMEQPYFASSNAMARTQTINVLKQMSIGVYAHNEIHRSMPPGATFDAHGQALHGWQTALLPFVEQEELHKRIRLDLPWQHLQNRACFQQRVPVYESPFIETSPANPYAFTHYSGNMHVLGSRALRLPGDFPDGSSYTLLMGDAAGTFVPWGKPGNWRDPALGINRGSHSFGNPSLDGAYFALADGSVRFISDKVSLETLKALATPAGGENINDPEW